MKFSDYKEINGVKLTVPQQNLLKTLELDYKLAISSEIPQSRMNRFSGAFSNPIHPVACAIVDFVYDVNTDYIPPRYRGKNVSVPIYDRARYLVLAIEPKAYGELLD